MSTITDPQTLVGKTLYDEDHEKVGKINNVYLDGRSAEPVFATVETGWFGSQETFVPISLTHIEDEGVIADAPKAVIKEAPHIDVDRELSPEDQEMLYSYYRSVFPQIDDAPQGSDDRQMQEDADIDMTDGRDVSGPTTDDAMTRSEERVHVDKTTEESGRARLKKYVVTEDVQMTVPVAREKIVLEREPITDENRGAAMDGPAISEEEHEVVLNRERVVVSKETVPTERVRLGKRSVEERQEVSEQVRKEKIDLIEDDPDRQ